MLSLGNEAAHSASDRKLIHGTGGCEMGLQLLLSPLHVLTDSLVPPSRLPFFLLILLGLNIFPP